MIYLIRHGLDDERFIGGHSSLPLTEEGIKQIKHASNFIVNNKLLINTIHTSDIKRAKQTAEIINKHLNVEIKQKKYLRELDKGDLTGQEREYALIHYKDYIKIQDLTQKYPNGESTLDFYKRIKQNIKKILEEDNTLIVTHRGVINMIYYILNNEYPTLDKEKWNVAHASIHEYTPRLKQIRRIH